MAQMRNSSPHPRRNAATVATALLGAALLGLTATPTPVSANEATLPLGDSDLVESRSSETLARGVTLTRIVRGTEPAPIDQIGDTPRGPWVVNVLTVDPRQSRGHLAATYGSDLAGVEKTTDLVRGSDALAGVNASFFTFTASAEYPGDPVGLGVYGGQLLSEPTGDAAEVALVLDAKNHEVLMGQLRWTGSVRNAQTKVSLPLEYVNHPPVVPDACTELPDPTQCAYSGDMVRFTPEFAASTPSGPGVEVVLDSRGCVVRTTTTRGTTLTPDQTSLQATGRKTADLLAVAQGCVKHSSTLQDEAGKKIPLRPGTFAVNGRYRLMRDGQVVAPTDSDGFFARHPRTIAGTALDGKIMLVTIDGRQTTSVGTTMTETATVAAALGMHNAVNLDGGGSTTMSVEGTLVNQPSGGAERPVGDALVYLDHRFSHR